MLRKTLQRAPLTLAAACLVASATANASSHREAPFITTVPKVDSTDFYLFNSYAPGREGFVTIIGNYNPLQDPFGGPNYFSMDENALYELHIDNDGDAVEDITFQFKFENSLANNGNGLTVPAGGTDIAVPLKNIGPIGAGDNAALNFQETYTVTMVNGDRRNGQASQVTAAGGSQTTFTKPLDYIGNKTFGSEADYEAYVNSLHNNAAPYNSVTFPGCPAGANQGRVFAGQRAEGFAVNLGETFDLVNFDPTAAEDIPENNVVRGKNITTIAVEVPKDCLTVNGQNVVGGWMTSSLRQARLVVPNSLSTSTPTPSFENPEVVGGAWTQLSRLSAPLVNEVVIGLPDKDRFNASEPVNDADNGFAPYVTNPSLPELLEILFADALGVDDVAPNNFPRNDLVAAFLTGFDGSNVEGFGGLNANGSVAEMLRLNTAVPATPMGDQNALGVAAGDLAGFPNGRRPGDDVVDIALRVSLGALCHNLPFDLNGDSSVDENDNLLLCGDTPSEAEAAAPVGDVAVRDGASTSAARFDNSFPYLTTPNPGSPNEALIPAQGTPQTQ